jgi:hypothetical protein
MATRGLQVDVPVLDHFLFKLPVFVYLYRLFDRVGLAGFRWIVLGGRSRLALNAGQQLLSGFVDAPSQPRERISGRGPQGKKS